MKYFIFISVLILTACSSHEVSTEKPFFDFASFIDSEVERLSAMDLKIEKHYEFNGEIIDTVIDTIDWKKELEPFRVDINKPAWINACDSLITGPKDGLTYSKIYRFESKKIPFKELTVTYVDSFNMVDFITITYKSKNYLYEAEKDLSYETGASGYFQYSISGTQDVKALEDSKYEIQARIIQR